MPLKVQRRYKHIGAKQPDAQASFNVSSRKTFYVDIDKKKNRIVNKHSMQQEQFIGGTAMFAATFQNRYIRAQATSWNGFSSALVSCSIAPHRVASTDGRRLGFRASTAKLETAVHRCNGSGRIKKPGVNTVITTLNRSPKTSGSAAPYE